MKKIMSALMALSITLCGVNSYSVNAVSDRYLYDEDYINSIYKESIGHQKICIVPVEGAEITAESLGIEGKLSTLLVETEPGERFNYDFNYCDEPFVCADSFISEPYEKVYVLPYNITMNLEEIKKLEEKPNVEEVYILHNVVRVNANIDGTFNAIGSFVYRKFYPDELVVNDANSDGEVTSEDALRILEAVTGNATLSIKEKVQISLNSDVWFEAINEKGIDYISHPLMSFSYNENFSSEKALEILQQIVGLK